jgi:hypothetical protein
MFLPRSALLKFVHLSWSVKVKRKSSTKLKKLLSPTRLGRVCKLPPSRYFSDVIIGWAVAKGFNGRKEEDLSRRERAISEGICPVFPSLVTSTYQRQKEKRSQEPLPRSAPDI